MSITPKQKSFLRSQAHSLKPVVTAGSAGLTEAVIKEIVLALEHHELIKVKISCGDRHERADIIEKICQKTHCEKVQSIGHIAVVYLPAKKPTIKLPN